MILVWGLGLGPHPAPKLTYYIPYSQDHLIEQKLGRRLRVAADLHDLVEELAALDQVKDYVDGVGRVDQLVDADYARVADLLEDLDLRGDRHRLCHQ